MKATIRFTPCKITPRIPVVKKPLINIGVVQGIATPLVGGTNPMAIAMYVITHKTNGVMINGIAIIGFKTIGSPKMIGSFILKSAAGADIFGVFVK